MNDLETQIRDTLRRHEPEAPGFDASQTRRAAVRTRRRQLRNVAGAGICALALVVASILGLDALVTPPPSQPATPTPERTDVHHGLPGANPAPAGVYSWNTRRPAWMHNVTGGASGLGVQMTLSTIPEVPANGGNPVTVAGYDGIHRRIGGSGSPAGLPPLGHGHTRGTVEEWIVDIDGTVVSIVLAAPSDTPEAELVAAHAIVESIRVAPKESAPGFRLTFELPDGWDRG